MTALTDAQLADIPSFLSGGHLPAARVEQIQASSGITLEQLMLALIPLAQKYAIPPISNFFVGAVARGSSGSIYLGANYEFPGLALSFTVHGEQAATAHAIAHGETGMTMIAVSAAPCGYCRQFLNELTTASTLQILLPDTPVTPLTTLLPNAFGPSDLDVTAALMAPQSHGLALPPEHRDDDVAQAALGAANSSYAPYSLSYSGVALKTKTGGIYTGGVAENAAFNPTMSPLEAAVVNLVIDGGQSYSDIVDAAVVEVPAAKASQVDATRAVLSTFTKIQLRVLHST